MGDHAGGTLRKFCSANQALGAVGDELFIL